MTAEALLPPLRHPVARLLLAAFVALHVGLALASTGPTPTTLAALVLTCGSAATVVLPARLPDLGLLAAGAAPLVASGLVLATLPVAGWPGYAAWPLGATTFIALALTLRDRLLAAWLLLAGLALESIAWSLLAGAGPLLGVDLVVRHAGTLLLGTLFALGLRRSARRTTSYRAAEREQGVLRAAEAATGREQRRAADRFLVLAGPALTALVDGEVGDESSLLSMEGRLRDEVTAPDLLTEHLNLALADARSRGVDVVVLQDADHRPASAVASEWLADRVRRAPPGRLVIRVRRAGGRPRVTVTMNDVTETFEDDRPSD